MTRRRGGGPFAVVALLPALLTMACGLGGVVPSASPPSSVAEESSDGAEGTPGGAVVQVFWSVGDGSDCEAVGPYERTVDPAGGLIRAAFDELVEGPTTEERAAGASSFFAEATAGAVRSTTLDASGRLVVDFDDIRALIRNASSSCGSGALLAGLNATAFQFSEVERVSYSFEGSCRAFFEFLPYGECLDFDRAGNQLPVLPTSVPAG